MDISVITTVYNDEKYIEESIISVQTQSCKDILSYEHIIVDDGSTDNTRSKIIELQKKYQNIKYYNFGKIGRAKALNEAINHSVGIFIANLDSDDIFYPDKLLRQYNFMIEHEECDLLCSKSLTFTTIIKPVKENKLTHSVIDHNLFKKNTINHSSVLFRRNKLIEIGMYNENRNAQIDLELWLRYLYNDLKICLLDEVLTGKRIHAAQNFERKNRLKYLFSATELKISYILKMKKYKYIPSVILRFTLGLLPAKLRERIRALIE